MILDIQTFIFVTEHKHTLIPQRVYVNRVGEALVTNKTT
jgi:hypothetical protein